MGSLATGLVWLAFSALLVAAGVLVTWALARRGRDRQAGTPQRLPAERYARGEIDGEEYVQRLRILRK